MKEFKKTMDVKNERTMFQRLLAVNAYRKIFFWKHHGADKSLYKEYVEV